MRKVLALMVLSAACGGDDGTDTPKQMDAGVLVDAEVMPDAQPVVEGMWRDTYHTAGGPVTVSSCNSPPTAVVVDPATAAVNQYNGACMPNGTFRIQAPGNLGTYYLRAGGILYETDKRAGLDLSTDRLGRNDVAAITGVSLELALTNLQSWTTGDLLVAFGANIGYRQNLSFTSGAPTAAATSLTATANWNGYKVDASKNDTLQIVQLGKHSTGTYDYLSLDRVFTAPSFTMENNMATELAGAFTTPSASALTLTVDAASFNQFEDAVAPSVTQAGITGSAYATPSTDAIESPPLLSFAQTSTGQTTMSFGSLSYRDPFPAGWDRMVKVQVGFSVPYMWNGITGTLSANVLAVVPKATAEAGTISATVGPPTDLTFDGADAFTANTITGVPVLSWSAPTVGTATDYEIQVYEVKSNGVALTFTSVLRMVTKQTSVRIPSGYLLGQRQYVFAVRARNREGVDVYTTPVRNGVSYSSADVLSALVTTSS